MSAISITSEAAIVEAGIGAEAPSVPEVMGRYAEAGVEQDAGRELPGDLTWEEAYVLRVAKNLPSQLLQLPVWLPWRLEKGPEGQVRPVAVYANGRAWSSDSVDDPAMRVTFAEAAAAFRADVTAGGVGIVLGAVPGEDIVLSCLEFAGGYQARGELDERVQDVLLAALSYAESAPDGRGVRVLGTGRVGTREQDAAGLGIYEDARFLAITGDVVSATRDLGDLTDAAALVRKLFLREPEGQVEGEPVAGRCSTVVGAVIAGRGSDRAEAFGEPAAQELPAGYLLVVPPLHGSMSDPPLPAEPVHSGVEGPLPPVQSVLPAAAETPPPLPNPVVVEESWPEIRDITLRLRPVAAFEPETLLPPLLRDWVMDEAERMPCAPDYIAAAALCGIGALIGARCAIKPRQHDSHAVVPNLWGALVGEPSARVRAAGKVALAWLDVLIEETAAARQEALLDYRRQWLLVDARREAIEARIRSVVLAGDAGSPRNVIVPAEEIEQLTQELGELESTVLENPVPRRFRTNDTSVEKLAELLRCDPEGLLVVREDLSGLLISLERAGRERDRTFFLEAWSGDRPYDLDRTGRGHVPIPNLCLSLLGGLRPEKLIAYLEQAGTAPEGAGLLSCCQMLVYPDLPAWEWRDRAPDGLAQEQVLVAALALARFEPLEWGATLEEGERFPAFRSETSAQALVLEWSKDLHERRIAGEEDAGIREHLLRSEKLCPALALIFHLLEIAAGGDTGPIRQDSVLRAVAWCAYLESHARRCHGLLNDGGQRAARMLSEKLRQGRLPDGFTLREVRRCQWRHLTSDDAVQAALDCLEEAGWVRPVRMAPSRAGGRPTVRYSLNPCLPRCPSSQEPAA